MRIALLIFVVLALALSASMAMAQGLLQADKANGAGGVFDTFTSTFGGAGYSSDVYNVTSGWVNLSYGGSQTNLVVAADVELFASQSWDNTGIYFHKANTSNPGPGVLYGTLVSNRAVYVGLDTGKAGADINTLYRVKDYSLASVGPDHPVALTWEGWDSGSGVWRAPDSVNSPGSHGTNYANVWWRVGGTAGAADPDSNGGAYSIAFRCTPAFSAYQAAGRYELDPQIVISPAM